MLSKSHVPDNQRPDGGDSGAKLGLVLGRESSSVSKGDIHTCPTVANATR
jgi:hypothetical protein